LLDTQLRVFRLGAEPGLLLDRFGLGVICSPR
jgi:hypothetical protein